MNIEDSFNFDSGLVFISSLVRNSAEPENYTRLLSVIKCAIRKQKGKDKGKLISKM